MSIDIRSLLGGQEPQSVQESSPEEQRLREAILHLIRVLLQIPALREILLQEIARSRAMAGQMSSQVGEAPGPAVSFLERLRQLRGEEE